MTLINWQSVGANGAFESVQFMLPFEAVVAGLAEGEQIAGVRIAPELLPIATMRLAMINNLGGDGHAARGTENAELVGTQESAPQSAPLRVAIERKDCHRSSYATTRAFATRRSRRVRKPGDQNPHKEGM